MWSLGETSSSEDKQHREANGKHGKCEQLASRQGTEIKEDVRVRFSDKLHQKTKQSVKTYKSPGHGARIKILSVQPLDNHKQDDPFQKSFV
jgi:hypothetical protein